MRAARFAAALTHRRRHVGVVREAAAVEDELADAYLYVPVKKFGNFAEIRQFRRNSGIPPKFGNFARGRYLYVPVKKFGPF